jgi:hypothetical protein
MEDIALRMAFLGSKRVKLSALKGRVLPFGSASRPGEDFSNFI